jgi:membrane protease YdiL (CAAX protease family)
MPNAAWSDECDNRRMSVATSRTGAPPAVGWPWIIGGFGVKVAAALLVAAFVWDGFFPWATNGVLASVKPLVASSSEQTVVVLALAVLIATGLELLLRGYRSSVLTAHLCAAVAAAVITGFYGWTESARHQALEGYDQLMEMDTHSQLPVFVFMGGVLFYLLALPFPLVAANVIARTRRGTKKD